MGFLTGKLERIKFLGMNAEQPDETGDSTEQVAEEPQQEIALSKLRDLRPEKDPIGAGRNRSPRSAGKLF